MNKIYLIIAAVITALGCQKIDTQQEILLGEGQVLMAYAPGEKQSVDTKVALERDEIETDKINASWEVGDVITLYEETEGADFSRFGNWKVRSVSANGTAAFEKISVDDPDLTSGVKYIAVYPSSTATDITAWEASTKLATTLIGMELNFQTYDASAEFGSRDGNGIDRGLKRHLYLKSAEFTLSDNTTLSFAHQKAMMTIIYNNYSTAEGLSYIDGAATSVYAVNTGTGKVQRTKATFMVDPNSTASRDITFFLLDSRLQQISGTVKSLEITTPFTAGKHYIWDTAPIPVNKVTLNTTAETLTSGATLQLSATIEPETVSNKGIAWSTTSSHATVDENGLVEIKENVPEGTTISVVARSKADNLKTATCTITIATTTPMLLSEINPESLPEGDFWMITDADATAGTETEFDKLQTALKNLPSSRTITILFSQITRIPDNALRYSHNYGGSFKIVAPNVTSIGEGAFEYSGISSSTANTTIEIDMQKLETIGEDAFRDSGLKSINAPKLNRIDDFGFGNCELEGDLVFENITYLGAYAFYRNLNMTSLSLPNLTSTGNLITQHCESLETLSIPKVTTVRPASNGTSHLISYMKSLKKFVVATEGTATFGYTTLSPGVTIENGDYSRNTILTNVDVVTHSSNIYTPPGGGDKLFIISIAPDPSNYAGPFKSITASN